MCEEKVLYGQIFSKREKLLHLNSASFISRIPETSIRFPSPHSVVFKLSLRTVQKIPCLEKTCGVFVKKNGGFYRQRKLDYRVLTFDTMYNVFGLFSKLFKYILHCFIADHSVSLAPIVAQTSRL
jgi:hypothetical protein